MVVHKDFAEDERWVYNGFAAQIWPGKLQERGRALPRVTVLLGAQPL